MDVGIGRFAALPLKMSRRSQPSQSGGRPAMVDQLRFQSEVFCTIAMRPLSCWLRNRWWPFIKHKNILSGRGHHLGAVSKTNFTPGHSPYIFGSSGTGLIPLCLRWYSRSGAPPSSQCLLLQAKINSPRCFVEYQNSIHKK